DVADDLLAVSSVDVLHLRLAARSGGALVLGERLLERGGALRVLRVRGEAAHEPGEHLLNSSLGGALVDSELLRDVADRDLVEQSAEVSHGFLQFARGSQSAPGQISD